MFKGNQQRVNNRRDLITSLKDYLDIGLISKLKSKSNIDSQDKVFTDNVDFWSQAIASNLYAGQVIKLENFKILEWIPSSPGLFHTYFAQSERENALRRHFEREKQEGIKPNDPRIIEFRPGDKRSMVKGGIGSLRIGPKSIENSLKYVMCATSNGVSHEGLVILLESEHYFKIISEIKEAGKIPTVNLIGRVMLIPEELSIISNSYSHNIPKFYIEIEQLDLQKNETPDQGVVSVAITYSREDDLKNYNAFSYSFCQFSPTGAISDLEGVTQWLRKYAIKYSGSESPLIVGDFDEYYNHFEKVQFPISEIANGKISIENLHKFQKLFDFKINETTMGDKNVFNNSQIGAVGSKAKATKNRFEQKNYSLPENLDFDLLVQELKELKKALKNKSVSKDEVQAVDEVNQAKKAAKKKDGNKVVQHLLNGGKWVLNTAKEIGIGVATELINRQIPT